MNEPFEMRCIVILRQPEILLFSRSGCRR